MKIREETLAALKDDESCDDEFDAMFQHVCQNAESYGISDEESANVLAHALILEREGKLYRTGEKRRARNGLWQHVFFAKDPN
jgi:hypothetical protein